MLSNGYLCEFLQVFQKRNYLSPKNFLHMFILGGCYNIHILTILRHLGSSLGTRPMSYSTMGLSEEIIPRPEWALTRGAEGRMSY